MIMITETTIIFLMAGFIPVNGSDVRHLHRLAESLSLDLVRYFLVVFIA